MGRRQSPTLSYVEDMPKPRETSTVYCNGFCSGSWSSQHSGDVDDMDLQPEDCRDGLTWSQNSHISGSFSPGIRQAGIRASRAEMLAQYEDKDAKVPDSLVEKAIDTVNTTQDIASVIWNVGWR